ncbi:MAG: copper transport protein, partial [Actinomycetota bacterium]|nr:copper transport protein [Actinomycetota bacterium]
MVRRAVILGALVLCLVGTPAAHAHGVLRASDPADRAVLEQAPTAVTLSFTEAPEPRLSSVQVLDGSGASFGAGDVAVVPGDPETLRLDLRTLPRGVYTVNWRIVSRVDGHLTAGTIAFGVQEPVTSAATVPAASVPSNRSAGAVGGRVLLYAGVTVLLGVAWTAIGLFGGRRRRGLHVLAVAGWA